MRPASLAQAALSRIMGGSRLEVLEAEALMEAIVGLELEEAQIAAVLGGIEARGVGAEELVGFASVLRRHMVAVEGAPEGAIDTCGTGGSGLSTLNTSTMAGLIASAAGAVVAKHGNRSASGRCGSLDVLEALGAEVDAPAVPPGKLLAEHGFAFLNARRHHPALGRVGPLRKALGFRTVFNILGPILSPARVRRQIVGLSNARLAPAVADALQGLGHERAWVVTTPSGLDELALSEQSEILEVTPQGVRSFRVHPSELGLEPAPFSAVEGGDIETNARRLREILSGEDRGPARDHVLLNAAAALVVADLAKDLSEGLERARAALDAGAALRRLDAWKEGTRRAAAAEEARP